MIPVCEGNEDPFKENVYEFSLPTKVQSKCTLWRYTKPPPKGLKAGKSNAQYQDSNKVYSTIKEQEDAIILSKIMRQRTKILEHVVNI